MPVAGGGFEQCYNAQAAVDTETMLIMVPQVTQAPNDKEQVAPMVEEIQSLPEGLNQPEQFLADAGYFSEANVGACEAAGIEPLIAIKRDQHHPHWSERFSEPPELPTTATAVQRMSHRLKTRAGKAAYALRKQTVEPVFGIIKSVMGQPLSSSPADWTTSRANGPWYAWRGISSAWPYCACSKAKAAESPVFCQKSTVFRRERPSNGHSEG